MREPLPLLAPLAHEPVLGHHWLLDLSGCGCDPALLGEADLLHLQCVAACQDVGMTILRSVFHQFPSAGVTGVVLLAESHLTLHTWPQERFVALDVYVCHHERDNTARGAALADRLRRLFQPRWTRERDVPRLSVTAEPPLSELTQVDGAMPRPPTG